MGKPGLALFAGAAFAVGSISGWGAQSGEAMPRIAAGDCASPSLTYLGQGSNERLTNEGVAQLSVELGSMAVALYKITTAQPNQIVYGNKMEIKYMAAGMTDPATGDFTSIELDVFFGDLTTESVPFARVPVTQEGVDFPPDWVACYDGDILRPTILATTITDSISELMTQP